MEKIKRKHTFVICAYKESPYLKECIKSLQDQTIESNIVIATSTPSDFINEISKEFNIPLYINPKQKGIGNDWNFALSLSKTKYVSIAHQDDIYLKTYAEKCIESLEKTDGIIAFTNYREIRRGEVKRKNLNLRIKTLMLTFIRMFPNSKFVRRRVLAFGSPICCPAVTYNISKLNQFKFSTDLFVSLDWEAWYRLSEIEGSFEYVSEDLMYHRIHQDSETTNSIENNRRDMEDLQMFRKFWPSFIAKLIFSVYKKSESSNFVEDRSE